MATTTHLALPLLAAAQAQKHVTHNEAVQRLDGIVQLAVKDRDLTSPPGTPSDGDRYIPASGASGDWQDWDLNIAWYVDGVWTKLVPRGGWIAFVEDEGLVIVHDGSKWVMLPAVAETWRVLAASAVAVAHTGTTAETTLATVTVPGGAMGPNGAVRMIGTWSYAGPSGKTARMRFGGASYSGIAVTTQSGAQHQAIISNRNSQMSQVGGPKNLAQGFGTGSEAAATSAIDTSANVDITFTVALNDGADSATLERYMVELLYRP